MTCIHAEVVVSCGIYFLAAILELQSARLRIRAEVVAAELQCVAVLPDGGERQASAHVRTVLAVQLSPRLGGCNFRRARRKAQNTSTQTCVAGQL